MFGRGLLRCCESLVLGKGASAAARPGSGRSEALRQALSVVSASAVHSASMGAVSAGGRNSAISADSTLSMASKSGISSSVGGCGCKGSV
eukprot:1220216-Amphidinium_carterae.1